MKILKYSIWLVLLLALGCGGGGGGDNAALSSVFPASQATAGVLKFSINGLPAGTKVGALRIMFTLPSGVTPTPVTTDNASESISFSGNALGISNSITGASFNSQIAIIGVASVGGLAEGEFMTMNCAIDSNVKLSAASFPATVVIDSINDTGSPSVAIAGVTIPISVTLK